jgi:hypothetical protein
MRDSIAKEVSEFKSKMVSVVKSFVDEDSKTRQLLNPLMSHGSKQI